MKFLPISLLFVSATFALGTHFADAKGRVIVSEARVSGPTIIAFAPSEVQGQNDDGAIEGVAHTNFAMQDTAKCLGAKKVELQFLFVDRLVVVTVKKRTTFQVGRMGQGFGAVLVQPGRPARVVYSEDGPSTLQYLLPNAAAEYWKVPACNDAG